MKTFSSKMLDTGADLVSAPYHSEGEINFELNPRTTELIIQLRTEMGVRAQTPEDGKEPDDAEAVKIMFDLAIMLVRTALREELSSEQALVLITNCGGIHGELVSKLASRFGVADVLLPAGADAGEQEELPTS